MIVMISSTARDLPKHREQVRVACERAGFMPSAMMEHLTAADANAVEVSLNMVENCDVYIGILALRYGTIIPGYDVSITEMEYDHATKLNKPRLIFFSGPTHPFIEEDIETGVGAEKLKLLKRRIGSERVAAFFNSPEDLRSHVGEAIARLRSGIRTAEDSFITKAERFASLKDDVGLLRRIICFKLHELYPGGMRRRSATREECSREEWHLIESMASAEWGLVAISEADEISRAELISDISASSWSRLRGWLDDESDFIMWSQHLARRRLQWEAAKERRKPSFLLMGRELEDAQRYLYDRPELVSPPDARYIALSLNYRLADRASIEIDIHKARLDGVRSATLSIANALNDDIALLLKEVKRYQGLPLESFNPPASEVLSGIAKRLTRIAITTERLTAIGGVPKSEAEIVDISPIIRDSISETCFPPLSLSRVTENINADTWRCAVSATVAMQLFSTVFSAASKAMTVQSSIEITVRNVIVAEEAEEFVLGVPKGDYVGACIFFDGLDKGSDHIDALVDPFSYSGNRNIKVNLVSMLVDAHRSGILIFPQKPKREAVLLDVFFPKWKKENIKTSAPRSDADLRKPKCVLVVDDDDVIRGIIAKFLRQEGIEAIEASDGDEGVEVFLQNSLRIDLLSVDILMPSMDGIEMVGEIKKIRPDIKFFFATGMGGDVHGLLARDPTLKGAFVLLKPFGRTALISKVYEAYNDLELPSFDTPTA